MIDANLGIAALDKCEQCITSCIVIYQNVTHVSICHFLFFQRKIMTITLVPTVSMITTPLSIIITRTMTECN